MTYSFITKTDLAQAYFPWTGRQSARHMLMAVIKDDAQLMADLIATGYHAMQRTLSPRQVELIVDRLGNPWRKAL
ncbi:MAG: DUF4248 domain-containing protein [Bacteroidaceae bacterium]|nr:DUF4248 domain-containing protein [Bacteroidaceae bacterium]